MTFLSIALPTQAAVSVAQTLASTIRPLFGIAVVLGLSVVTMLLMVFRPLMIGIWHAAVLVVKPRLSIEERVSRRKMRGVLMLNRMANEFDASQPNFAAELRNFASRD